MYGITISFSTLIEYSSLLQCFGLKLIEKDEGNWTLGRHFFDLLARISCMGKKCLSRVMVNVAVIIRLLVDPLIDTHFDPFAAMFLLESGMYFDGVWFKLRTNDSRISFSSIFQCSVNTLF